MKRLAYILLVACGCTSCVVFNRENRQDVAVQAGNSVLTKEELRDATKEATTPEDSAQLAETYIREWAGMALFQEKAMKNRNAEIEEKVEQYRRDLYLHMYEEKLVNQKMDKHVAADSVAAFYEQHKEMFVLDEHIIKGVLMVIPNGAPDMAKIRKWLQKPTGNIEQIEKYAYQYATGYELFLDEWHSGHQLRMKMPIDAVKMTEALKKQSQIEVADSLQTYILEVTEKQLAGEAMPLDFATKEITNILLSDRQHSFLQQQKDDMYEDGVLTMKVRIKEQ